MSTKKGAQLLYCLLHLASFRHSTLHPQLLRKNGHDMLRNDNALTITEMEIAPLEILHPADSSIIQDEKPGVFYGFAWIVWLIHIKKNRLMLFRNNRA